MNHPGRLPVVSRSPGTAPNRKRERRKLAALCACIGGCSAIVQNEMLIRGTGPNESIMLVLKVISGVRGFSVLVSGFGV